MKKRAFTLIELLIVICILGMFVGVLFKTYTTISQISFRVEQQKLVNEDVLFLSQMLQNFANRNQIDYSKYGSDLPGSKGFTDILYLTGEDGELKIYSSGNCVSFGSEPSHDQLFSGCAIYAEKDGESIKLTNDFVYFSQIRFKIIPYSNSYFTENDQGNICNTNYFACVNDMGFWIFADVYNKLYNKDIWSNNVYLLVQQFFNN